MTGHSGSFGIPFTTFAVMDGKKEDYNFWTKYKRYAGNELLLYLIMIVGIILGIIIFS